MKDGARDARVKAPSKGLRTSTQWTLDELFDAYGGSVQGEHRAALHASGPRPKANSAGRLWTGSGHRCAQNDTHWGRCPLDPRKPVRTTLWIRPPRFQPVCCVGPLSRAFFSMLPSRSAPMSGKKGRCNVRLAKARAYIHYQHPRPRWFDHGKQQREAHDNGCRNPRCQR